MDSTFYFNYVRLCNEKGISPSAAAEEMGYERSSVTRWRKGGKQRDATIQKVADYFGVPVEELQKEKPAHDVDELVLDLTGLTEENRELLRAMAAKLLASQSPQE